MTDLENLAFQNMQFLNLSLVWGSLTFLDPDPPAPLNPLNPKSRSTKLSHMLSTHAMDLSHILLLVILLNCAQLPRSILILSVLSSLHAA
jgi:hypothetical protein